MNCRARTEDGSDVILFQLKSIYETRLLPKFTSVEFSTKWLVHKILKVLFRSLGIDQLPLVAIILIRLFFFIMSNLDSQKRYI